VTVDQVHQKARGSVEKWCKIFALVVINDKHMLRIIIDSPFVKKENNHRYLLPVLYITCFTKTNNIYMEDLYFVLFTTLYVFNYLL